MITWDILIITIEHRHEKLARLLDSIEPQIVPGVNIIIYRDNLESCVGVKRQLLLETSTADYVSFIDDDDEVPTDWVFRVMSALESRPDYVGWQETLYVNGTLQRPVYHSLQHGKDWYEDTEGLYRGITHHNPIKRSLALAARFDMITDGPGEDHQWSVHMHGADVVHSEVMIDAPMYIINHDVGGDWFHAIREPMVDHPPILTYPFVKYVGPDQHGEKAAGKRTPVVESVVLSRSQKATQSRKKSKTSTTSDAPTFDILIASIEHRHDQLKELLDALEPQIVPGVHVLVFRDNLQMGIGPKRQLLLEAALAEYVAFIDDDDTVAADYVSQILDAAESRPDYIGFEQVHTLDGAMQVPVYHSLRYGTEWDSQCDYKGKYRGITHFNPIRRELALLSRFDTIERGCGEDHRWAIDLTNLNCVKTEVVIDAPLHYHRESTVSGFNAYREPLVTHPPLPEYPFVQYLKQKEK